MTNKGFGKCHEPLGSPTRKIEDSSGLNCWAFKITGHIRTHTPKQGVVESSLATRINLLTMFWQPTAKPMPLLGKSASYIGKDLQAFRFFYL